MIFGIIIIIILYTLLNLYLAWRYMPVFRAVIPKLHFWCVAVLFLIPALSYALPYFLPMWGWVRSAGALGGYWMGFFAYSMLFFVILEVPGRLIVRRAGESGRKRYSVVSSGIVLMFCIALLVGGRLHAQDIVRATYEVPFEEDWDGPPLKVALLSDVHLGHINGVKRMEQIVEAINEEQADIVCIAGDLFDSSYEGVKEPEQIAELMGKIKSKYGVFLSWGNHDAGTGFADMRNLMEKAGVQILEDEAFRIEGVCTVVGRRDSAPIGNQGEEREAWGNAEGNEPVLVMDHRPTNADEYESEDVELVVSGHTHAGQLFPFNLLTRLAEKYNYGYHIAGGGVPVIVTSGVGTWGPPIRVGTDSELALILMR